MLCYATELLHHLQFVYPDSECGESLDNGPRAFDTGIHMVQWDHVPDHDRLFGLLLAAMTEEPA